jgi:hypothetical protein
MSQDHTGNQTYDDTRCGKADALEEPDCNVIGGLGGHVLRIALHLNAPPEMAGLQYGTNPRHRRRGHFPVNPSHLGVEQIGNPRAVHGIAL